MPQPVKKQLEGIRVIDLTAWLAGPFLSMQMAAMGAEVIKIQEAHRRRNPLSRLHGSVPDTVSAQRACTLASPLQNYSTKVTLKKLKKKVILLLTKNYF